MRAHRDSVQIKDRKTILDFVVKSIVESLGSFHTLASMKRGREEDAPAKDLQAEFMSQPEAPTSQLSQDPAAMVGVDLSATDHAVISNMSREELEHFWAALLAHSQPASEQERRAFRAKNLADQLRAVLGGGDTGRAQWKSAKYIVSPI